MTNDEIFEHLRTMHESTERLVQEAESNSLYHTGARLRGARCEIAAALLSVAGHTEKYREYLPDAK